MKKKLLIRKPEMTRLLPNNLPLTNWLSRLLLKLRKRESLRRRPPKPKLTRMRLLPRQRPRRKPPPRLKPTKKQLIKRL